MCMRKDSKSKSNPFFHSSVWCLDAIKSWFGVSVDVRIPQCSLQHPNSCLNSCSEKRAKEHITILSGMNVWCEICFLRISNSCREKPYLSLRTDIGIWFCIHYYVVARGLSGIGSVSLFVLCRCVLIRWRVQLKLSFIFCLCIKQENM